MTDAFTLHHNASAIEHGPWWNTSQAHIFQRKSERKTERENIDLANCQSPSIDIVLVAIINIEHYFFKCNFSILFTLIETTVADQTFLWYEFLFCLLPTFKGTFNWLHFLLGLVECSFQFHE